MWISISTYKKLLSSQESFHFMEDRLTDLYRRNDRIAKDRDYYKEECDRLREVISEYKQKYADEVQKRLELIKQVKRSGN